MMDKKICLVVTLVFVGLTLCFSMSSDAQGPPLPNNINIVSPSPNLPKDIAAFSGKWAGAWSHGAEIILVVEEIQDTWATVVYSWGATPRFDPGFSRQKCKVISDSRPKIEWVPKDVRNAHIYFEVQDSNTLVGSQKAGGIHKIHTITLKRVI